MTFILNTLNERDWKEDVRERSVENRGENNEKIMKEGRRHNLVQIVNRVKKRDNGGVSAAVGLSSWNRDGGLQEPS